jgi:hypothetical protein
MTVFDVFLNGRKLCRAGVGADGVLNAIISWAKLIGPAARTARQLKSPSEETKLHVGGLRGDTHRQWAARSLKVGDRVAVAVSRARGFDPPIREQSRDPRLEERAERRSYARLKRRFEGPMSPSARQGPFAIDDRETQFLNVDLDIWSRQPLQPLVKAFGPKAFALHVGKESRRRHGAHLELVLAERRSADEVISGLVKLVKRLPPWARLSWKQAEVRQFNVGIQAGTKPFGYELGIQPETLRAIADVNAGLVFTVYAATSSAPGI